MNRRDLLRVTVLGAFGAGTILSVVGATLLYGWSERKLEQRELWLTKNVAAAED